MKKPAPVHRSVSSVPCGHCGSPLNYGVHIGEWDGQDNHFHVCCLQCGATGPTATTKEDAVAFWEFRSEPINEPPQPKPADGIPARS